MSVGAVLPIALGLVGSQVAKTVFGGKPKAQTPTPQPTRIEARERAERNDYLARRQGSGANRRVGFGAGEAATRGRTSLLGRGG
jgi:hypothetical protein